jgi:hypothetical protein
MMLKNDVSFFKCWGTQDMNYCVPEGEKDERELERERESV